MSSTRLASVFTVALVSLVMAANARAGIWGIRSTGTSSAPSYSAGPVELFSINEDGSGYVDHGDIFNLTPSALTNFDALAVSPHYGLMAFEIFSSGTTSRLSTINPAGDGTHAVTGTKVNLALSGREIRGAVFDLKDRLWALDTTSSQLLQVDPVTGGEKAGSVVGLSLGGSPYTFSGNTVDLAVRSDGSFFMTAVDGGVAKVFSLDETTGALTQVYANSSWLGEVGSTFPPAAAPNHLFAFDVSGAEDFVRYDLTGPAITRTHLFTLPGTMNSGRGDMAARLLAQPVFRHFGDADPYLDEAWSRRVVGSGITVGPEPGENAWKVDDQNSAGGNGYAYFLELTPEEQAAALAQGWELRMALRVEDIPNTVGGAVGAQVAFPGPMNRIFTLGFGTDAAGNPIAGIYEGGGVWDRSSPIPGDGYHYYEMIFDPVTQTVDLFADGVEILTNQFGYTHTGQINRVLFGANSSADTGTGYYRFVQFQIAPEPSTLVLLGLAALGLLFRPRRRPRGRSKDA